MVSARDGVKDLILLVGEILLRQSTDPNPNGGTGTRQNYLKLITTQSS